MSKVFEIAFQLGGELTSSFKKTFGEANSAFKLAGAAAAALGGTAVFAGVATQVMDMNQSLTQLSAQTGLISEDFEGLKGTAQNLFRNNYGEDFNEVTAALANVKQNMHSLNDVDLEQFTGEAMMFTKTFDEDMNDVTRAANNMMSAFGVNAATSMDLFAAGAQRGLNFSDEMLDNVAEYAPLFGEMGYSAEEYFGILERGAQAGVYNLDYVNDVMKEFQIRAKDGSKATSDAMGALSKDTQQVWNDFLKGNGTVSDVASTVVGELKGMEDQVAANQIAVALFGTKWEDLEADAMYAMLGTTDAMQGFEGAMATVNQIQFESFNAAIRGIGRMLFMDLVYPIGDMVLPYLNQFANYLSSNLPSAIEKGKAAIKEFGPIALAVAGAFLTYKGVMQGVATYQKTFNAIQAITPKLLHAQRTAMLASTFAGGGLKGMMAGLRSGMTALNMTMLANPFVLAAVAIAALGAGFVLLYNKSETFRAAVQPLFVAFQAAISQIGTAVMSVLPIIIAAFSTLGTTISDIATAVIPILLSVIQMVIPIIVTIIQTMVPLIVAHFQMIAGIITNVVIPAINFLLPIIQTVVTFILTHVQNLITLITGIIQAGMAILQGDWSGAWEIIKGTAETIMNNIIGFFQGINLFDVGKSIIKGLINGIKSMGGAVVGAITEMIPEPIRGTASKFLGTIPGFAKGGVVSAPTLAWIGEGGDTETVIPWNNSQRSKDLWLQTGQALGMLNNDGALDNIQQQIELQTQANNSHAIRPDQVSRSVGNRNSNKGPIVVQYNPQYNVQNPEDLKRVQEHAEKDKDDLAAKLEEIKRNEERTSFDD